MVHEYWHTDSGLVTSSPERSVQMTVHTEPDRWEAIMIHHLRGSLLLHANASVLTSNCS